MKPPPPIEQTLHKVTYHAVTRYVQRILGITVPVNYEVSERVRAAIHCKKAKTTISDIRSAILIPTVAVALENKFSAIDTRNFTAILDPENKIIVTILAPQPYMQSESGQGRPQRSGALLCRIADRISMQVKGITSIEKGE